MTTTIRTSSKNYFNKIQKYLRSTSGRLQGKNNKRIFFTPSFNDGIYALTIFDLTTIENNSLIQKNDQTLPPLTQAAGAFGNRCLNKVNYLI